MTDLFVGRGLRLAARKVAGEMVILTADDSSLFVLNEAGTLLWEAADGRTTLGALVDDVLCREYEVGAEVGARDATEFVEALVAHGVLRVSAEPLADTPRVPEVPAGEGQ